MSRLHILLMCILTGLIVCNGLNAQITYQIGDSLTTNSPTDYPCPYGNDNDDSRHQMLFRASELSAAGMTAGDINSFAMWILQSNGTLLFDYTIEMGLTTDTVLGTQYLPTSATVWGPQDYTNVDGWNIHSFGTPFFWDGISNVVVQTCNNNQFNSDNPIMVHTTTPWTSTIYDLTNNGNICGGNNQPSDQSFDRPVIRFELTPAFAAPISDFTPQGATYCSNTVQFQDLSTFDPISWLWNFGDGNTDTVQNPLHTYASDGSYTVTLITSNQFGSDTLIVNNAVNVNGSQPQPISACIPSTSNILAGFGIADISFLSTNVSSPDGASENYADRACQLDTVLAGTAMNISITTANAAPHNIKVWIDWDNSGTFSASEEILTANSVFNAASNITVPSNAVLNTPLRLRAVADYQLSPIPTACGNPQYGQAEDYGIVIEPNTQAPATSFDSNIQNTCDGVVQFNDLSLNSPTVWQWAFGDGNTSNAQNPSHTYLNDGTYTVTLITFNSFGSDTLVLTNYITVTLGSQLVAASCTPQTQTVLGDYGIVSVDLATISNTSPGASEGYQDRSCQFSTSIQEGISTPISIGTGVQNSHDVFVWLDLDNDGSFSSNELIWSALGVTNPTGNLIVPFGAVFNTPLRLRITADAQGNISDACDDPAFGQTEDYGLTITQNLNPPTAFFDASPTSVCAGAPVQFNDLSQNLPATWSWDFGDGNSSMLQNPVHTYTMPGTYTVSLNVSNPNGNDGATLINYITVLDSLVCDTSQLTFFNSPLTLTNCGGVVVDNGGPNGNYSQIGQGLVSIQPTSGTVVILDFAQFELRNQDDLIVYDGPDDNSPVIGTYSGNQLPNGGQIISSGPSISFELDIAGGGGGGGGFEAGFIINWSCSFVGIEEAGSSEMMLFPNPVSDELHLVFNPSDAVPQPYRISNIAGQELITGYLSLVDGSGQINVSDLPAGTYFIELPDSPELRTKRFIVQ